MAQGKENLQEGHEAENTSYFIVSADLEKDGTALLGKEYSFNTSLNLCPNDLAEIGDKRYDTSVLTSENLQLQGEWHKTLEPTKDSESEHTASFKFKAIKTGSCSIRADVLFERHWFGTMKLEFNAVEAGKTTTVHQS